MQSEYMQQIKDKFNVNLKHTFFRWSLLPPLCFYKMPHNLKEAVAGGVL